MLGDGLYLDFFLLATHAPFRVLDDLALQK